MLIACNSGAGQNLGFPDTCNTPTGVTGTAPIPYPNIAMNAQASPFSQTVRICGMNALNMSTKIPKTMGDEAGVAHSSFMQQAGYTMGNPTVFIEQQPGINLACPSNGNNMNCPAAAVAVPSAANVFFTYVPTEGLPFQPAAADPHGRLLGSGHLEHLGQAMSAPAVSSRMVTSQVIWIRIAIFNASVPTLVYRALRHRGAAAPQAAILDLRGNPGGDTDALVRLADDFLPQDAILIRQVDEDGDEEILRARQAEPYDLPVVILVDGNTASAAELFAGCLQHHGRAVVVGARTHGKGRGQRVVPDLSGKGVYYASVASCLLPDGRPIEGRGIEPDVTVGSAAAGDDPALAAALAVLGHRP